MPYANDFLWEWDMDVGREYQLILIFSHGEHLSSLKTVRSCIFKSLTWVPKHLNVAV